MERTKTRLFCITITVGTCEFVIEISDKNYYGLGRVDLPRIYLNLETANYRGGFNVVGKDPPSKLDTATEDGNTVDLPSSFNIRSAMVARHIFRTPDDGSGGYPKRIKFTIDSCLFILPAPWGGLRLQVAKDLYTKLPSATLQLSARGSRRRAMKQAVAALVAGLALFAACVCAWPQEAMLAPPRQSFLQVRQSLVGPAFRRSMGIAAHRL